ncbi:hypothetical protein [Methylobacterium sp. CM6257]
MSTADTQFEAAVERLSRRIAEAEMRSTAAADALTTLTRTEGETAEAEQRFKEEMDALWVLRRQLWELRAPEGP